MSEGIYWLSSYPKSGNTWFRIVLARILSQAKSYINDIDEVLGSPMLVSRTWFNQAMAFDSSLLRDDEIDLLRPAAHKWYATQLKHTTYIKTHDAYTYVQEDRPLFPAEGCLGAVYFIRNPLDVAISLAHHAQCSLDASIYIMANQEFTIPFASQSDRQLRQKLLTWSMHVQSWVNNPLLKVLVLRYEDMFYKPLETFAQGMKFLGIEVAPGVLAQAIEDACFNKLQHYEQQFGFKEKPGIKGQFFRKGIVGDWRETLTAAQIEKVIADHAEVMRFYGYVDEFYQPVVYSPAG